MNKEINIFYKIFIKLYTTLNNQILQAKNFKINTYDKPNKNYHK